MIDMDHEELHYASAGHPPFVLMAPGAASSCSTGEEAGPRRTRRADHRRDGAVPVGSALVAYTDGLVERRARDLTAVMVGELSCAMPVRPRCGPPHRAAPQWRAAG